MDATGRHSRFAVTVRHWRVASQEPIDLLGKESVLPNGSSVTTLTVKLVDAMMRATLEQFISIHHT